ncbi:MAG: helix-turn-helix domain-containing protein [Clostridia bacterium]|nr:helix-turn-helix domain-containing protein [Clostridia bacterium]
MKVQNTEQILGRLITEKDKKESLRLSMQEYEEISGQKVIVRCHLGNDVWHYHTHEFYEINYVAKGSCINLVEEEPIIMSEGEWILINPETYHLPYCDGNSLIINFIFDASWFEEQFAGDFEHNPVFAQFMNKENKEDYYRYIIGRNTDGRINKAAQKLITVHEIDDGKKFILMQAAAIEFIAELIYGDMPVSLSETQGKNSRAARELIKYMTDNYTNVTLENLSEYIGYSKTHICRIFKEKIGKSFSEILTDIRISRAKYIMLNSNMSMKEIAFKTGYDSAEYFQRLFKKKTGTTPGEYRNENRTE